ncbi:hypothetical protein M8J75_011199 [Diaphorina citri]|nr:hypothetical protein M8J75_011199 [Diaphorina citri]
MGYKLNTSRQILSNTSYPAELGADPTMVPYSLLTLLLHSHLIAIIQGGGMKTLYEWSGVDFTWPSSRIRDNAIRDGKYDPSKVAILDVDVFDPTTYGSNNGYAGGPNKEKRIFVTTPKFQPGIPVTLSTLSSKRANDGSHLLEPFPNWSTHNEKDCDGLISVYRVQIDECGKLWVLDTGKLNTFTGSPKKLCNPQIVVYDLTKGDKIVLRHRFPEAQVDDHSLPITIAVDTRNGQCTSQYAYIADVNAFKLMVFDLERCRSWRVNSNYFYPFPTYGTFDLNGVQFDLMDGIFGIALGPLLNGNRRVYFHALASVKEGWTLASVLLNQTLLENSLTPTNLFKMSDYGRNSQSTSEVMSDEGVLFFPLLKSNSLACWNSKTVYKQDNIVTLYTNDQTFQFPSGMKLIANRDLYVLTSRLQNYIANGRSDTSQINFRILVASIADLTRKTSCDVARFDFTGYLTLDDPSSGNNVNIQPGTGSGNWNAQGSKFSSSYAGPNSGESDQGAPQNFVQAAPSHSGNGNQGPPFTGGNGNKGPPFNGGNSNQGPSFGGNSNQGPPFNGGNQGGLRPSQGGNWNKPEPSYSSNSQAAPSYSGSSNQARPPNSGAAPQNSYGGPSKESVVFPS